MSESPTISPALLDLICCPVGKQPLELKGDRLVCTSCGLSYRIDDGIPVLLAEEAELPAGVGSLDEVRCGGRSGTAPGN